MATTTKLVLMANLARVLPHKLPLITGTATAGSTTSFTDATLVRYDANDLLDAWAYIDDTTDDAAPIGESRRITTVTSAGVVTLVSALTAAMASGDTFRIYEHDPTLMAQALERAIRFLSPVMPLLIRNETLIVDNLLANASLDTFSTTFTSWSNIGTPTLAAETSRRVHGTGSASIAATGATEGIEQDIINALDIDQVVGKTLHVRGWVWSAVASSSRIRVTFDGSTYTNSTYHTGDAEWEGPGLQRIDVAIPADMTECTVSCEVASGDTGYFDLMAAYVAPLARYTMPTSLYPHGPHKVSYQLYEERPEGIFVPIGTYRRPVAGRVLRLEGYGRLTVPSTDSATIELDEVQAEIVVRQAAAFLQDTGEDLRAEAEMVSGGMAANERKGWDMLNDSGTLYLTLDR